MAEFKLPDLGEGLQDAEILEWHIKEGDQICVDQLILVVETAKAVVDIPSPVDATVTKIMAQVGDSVDVSADLFSYQSNSKVREVAQPELKHGEAVAIAEEQLGQTAESVSVVGNLPDSKTSGQSAFEGIEVSLETQTEESFHTQSNRRNHQRRMASSPSVMSLAKKLGLESRVAEHQYGELTETDIVRMYEDRLARDSDVTQIEANPRNSIIKLAGARKVMAQSMTKSHQHIPSVTLFDDAEISHWAKGTDITLKVISALISATKAVPLMNAWFDEDTLSVQLFEDVHLGVAVNSKDGLFVPVLRQAQALDQDRIRQILDKQIRQVSDRSIKPQAMLGATISLSNFGTLSGRYATPIIVPPQVAIIGVGQIRSEPIVRDDKVVVGRVMPLSLSFDHRAASGSDAAAFMSALIGHLTL